MDYVIGLDLGRKTGWAVATYPDGEIEAGRWVHSKKGKGDEDPKDAVMGFSRDLVSLLDQYQPIALAYEDPGFETRANSQLWIRRFEGVVLQTCGWRELLCVQVNTSTWRAHAFSNGATRPPPQSEKGAQKQACLKAAYERGWVPEPHQAKCGDAADAAWVLDYFCTLDLMQAGQVSMSL